MDIQTLSQQLLTSLAPFLPYLLKMGEQAAEEAGEKLGAEAWEGAKALWAKLRKKEQVAKVAEAAAAVPENKPLQEALREQIARALQEDPQLRQEVQPLVTIISRVETGDVLPGGSVTGVEIGSIGGGKVDSKVKSGDVSGNVTVVKIERVE